MITRNQINEFVNAYPEFIPLDAKLIAAELTDDELEIYSIMCEFWHEMFAAGWFQ